MASDVIMPALGMAQETGKVIQWLKAEGDEVTQGEPLLEVETDKITVEVEAPASGVLANLTANEGDDVPVGETIALILAEGESAPASEPAEEQVRSEPDGVSAEPAPASDVTASPVAARMAEEHNVDLRRIKPDGGRILKADVVAYLEVQREEVTTTDVTPKLFAASPKARRLASDQGLDIADIAGSGPEGAVLAADVLTAEAPPPDVEQVPAADGQVLSLSTAWRVMAERITQSWTSVPHFYLVREVNASRLVDWRADAQNRIPEKITYTDLLVKLVTVALREHPRLNAQWEDGTVTLNDEINVGLAVAVEEGLLVPVMRRADTLGLSEIAERRQDLVDRALAGKLKPDDLQGGTFTLSNLGMFGIDAFNAIVNPPESAILAVGRIAERVVPVDSAPAVQPMMTLTLSCDHRVVDGARGARFLQTLTGLITEPLRMMD